MTTEVLSFEDVPWVDLVPPEQHPAFEYEGFHPGQVLRIPKGHVLREGYGAFPVATLLERDCKVPMRDGISLYTNVYRADEDPVQKQPALIAWSPYGKCSGGSGSMTYDRLGPHRIGIPYENLSGYETFEGPNPADWVRRGYCVVDPDARGACHSEGNIVFWGPQEALDVYDLIQWCTEQPWCDGNAVMFGNSWLAISQINHASRCAHPALKAIAPWEGASDPYRDLVVRGGVPVTDAFGSMLLGGLSGYNKVEDNFGVVTTHPLYDDYWQSKRIDPSKIRVPMYLTASYSSGFHSRGSFETFSKAHKDSTWLRVHSTQEWHDLYQRRTMDDLQLFYDHFAKGVDNCWPQTPHLRLSLLAMVGSTVRSIEERPEDTAAWPLPGTMNRKLYFDSQNMKLTLSSPTTLARAEAIASYNAHSLDDKISFAFTFASYTELSGLPWARLYMSCDTHDDMDVHISIRKLGVNGQLLSYANYPVPVPISKLPDINVCKFQGPSGVLRASHCVSQESKAHPDDYPVQTHTARELVRPGTVVAMEIPIWPIGMVFDEGEGIQVSVAGHNLRLPEVPSKVTEPMDSNKGIHSLHTGGEYASFMMMPFLRGSDNALSS